jgi:hypothetical protein
VRQLLQELAVKMGGLSSAKLKQALGTLRAAPRALINSARALARLAPQILKRFVRSLRKLVNEFDGASRAALRRPTRPHAARCHRARHCRSPSTPRTAHPSASTHPPTISSSSLPVAAGMRRLQKRESRKHLDDELNSGVHARFASVLEIVKMSRGNVGGGGGGNDDGDDDDDNIDDDDGGGDGSKTDAAAGAELEEECVSPRLASPCCAASPICPLP